MCAVVGAVVTQLVCSNATPHFVVQHAAALRERHAYVAMTQAVPSPRLRQATSADAALGAASAHDLPALADAVLLCALHGLAVAQCTAGFVHGDLCTKNILMTHVPEHAQVVHGAMRWRGADDHTYEWVLPSSAAPARVTIPAEALQYCLPLICDFGGSSAFCVSHAHGENQRGVAFISTFDPANQGVVDAAQRTLVGVAGKDIDEFIRMLPGSLQHPRAAEFADALCNKTVQGQAAGAAQVARALRRAVRYSAKRWRLPPGACMAYDAQYLICCMLRDIRNARASLGASSSASTLAEYAAQHLFEACGGQQRHGTCYASKTEGHTALDVLQFFALSDIKGGSKALRQRWRTWARAPPADASATYHVHSQAAQRM